MTDEEFINWDEHDKRNSTSYSTKCDIVTIKSLLHGIYYSSNKPGEKPFVSVGDIVSEEDTVCIVDCMKMMNEIPADVEGKIIEVLAKDGDEVTQGQPLFKVDTTKSLEEPWTC